MINHRRGAYNTPKSNDKKKERNTETLLCLRGSSWNLDDGDYPSMFIFTVGSLQMKGFIFGYFYHILKPDNATVEHSVPIVDTMEPICMMTGRNYELESVRQPFW